MHYSFRFVIGLMFFFMFPVKTVVANPQPDPFGGEPYRSLGDRDEEIEVTMSGFGTQLQVTFQILEMSYADFNTLKNDILKLEDTPDLESFSDLTESMNNVGDLFSGLIDLDFTEFIENASLMRSVTQIANATMKLDYQKKAVFWNPMKIVYPTSWDKDPRSPEVLVPGNFQSRTLGLSLSLTAEALENEEISLKGEYDFVKFVDVMYYSADKNYFSNKLPQPVFESKSSQLDLRIELGQTAFVSLHPMSTITTSVSPETSEEMVKGKSKVQIILLSIKKL